MKPAHALLASAVVAFAATASAQYNISWSKLSAGSGTSSSAHYSVTGTIGQPDAGGTVTGGNYAITAGFWSLGFVVETSSPPATNSPPVILSQPVSQAAQPDGSATLSVSVSGTPPLTYQWLHDGTNIQNVPIITFVGGSESGGQATNAALYNPGGIAMDASTNLYIADTLNNLVHKVDVNGVIATVAGVGNGALNGASPAFSGDGGPATNASLARPFGVAVDASGNLFIADTYNNRIRKVDTNGMITTVAGTGAAGHSGDGGAATNAGVYQPRSVAVEGSGELLIADFAYGLVRKVDTNGIITTVAGGGSTSPAVGLMATNCLLEACSSVALDAAGYFYAADWYYGTVWQVAPNGAISNVLHGFSNPGGLTVGASGLVYVANTSAGNSTVVAASSSGALTLVAGKGPATFGGDGAQATNAYLNYPSSLVRDPAGNIYIADTDNNRIRKVGANGVIQTVAGNGFNFYAGDGGPAVAGLLGAPKGLAADALGNLFIADYNNHCVRKVDTSGLLATVVGNGTEGYTPPTFTGQATNTQIAAPYALALDPNENLFLSDSDYNQVLRVNANGLVSTVAGPGASISVLSAPDGLACDHAGNLYIADRGNDCVRKIDASGNLTTVAGGGSSVADGIQATNARVFAPEAVAVDQNGNLYISIDGQSLVRKVDTSGVITTVAGNGSFGFSGDGQAATKAAVDYPAGLVLDTAGNLFFADWANNRVRRVDTNGIITTVAGTGTAGYFGDGGQAVDAWLNSPDGLALDPAGNLYVADTANNRVRKVLLPGSPTLVLDHASAAAAGSYQVIVSNPWASATSSVATLTVSGTSAPIVIQGVERHSDGSFDLTGTGSPSTRYVLNLATNLAPPVTWVAVVTNTATAAGAWQFTAIKPAGSRSAFFRVSGP
jgi:sugar lactone lactonase YvrE